MRFLVFISVFYFTVSFAMLKQELILAQELTIKTKIHHYLAEFIKAVLSQNPKLFSEQYILDYQNFHDFEFAINQKMEILSSLLFEITSSLTMNSDLLSKSEILTSDHESEAPTISVTTKVNFFNLHISSSFEIFNKIRKLHPYLKTIIPVVSASDSILLTTKQVLEHTNSLILNAFKDIDKYDFFRATSYIGRKNLSEIQEAIDGLTQNLEIQQTVIGRLDELLYDYKDSPAIKTAVENLSVVLLSRFSDYQNPDNAQKQLKVNAQYYIFNSPVVSDLIEKLSLMSTLAISLHSRLYPQ